MTPGGGEPRREADWPASAEEHAEGVRLLSGRYATLAGLHWHFGPVDPQTRTMRCVQVDPSEIPAGADVIELPVAPDIPVPPCRVRMFEALGPPAPTVGSYLFHGNGFWRCANRSQDGTPLWQQVGWTDVPGSANVWHTGEQRFTSRDRMPRPMSVSTYARPANLTAFTAGPPSPQGGTCAFDGQYYWRCIMVFPDGTSEWEKIYRSEVPAGSRIWHAGQQQFLGLGPEPGLPGSYLYNASGYWKMARYNPDGTEHWVRLFKPPQGKMVYDSLRGGWVKIPIRFTPNQWAWVGIGGVGTLVAPLLFSGSVPVVQALASVAFLTLGVFQVWWCWFFNLDPERGYKILAAQLALAVAHHEATKRHDRERMQAEAARLERLAQDRRHAEERRVAEQTLDELRRLNRQPPR